MSLTTLYRYGNESYEAVMRRRTAANVLHNPDLLMMRAQALGQVYHPFPSSIMTLLETLSSHL